MQVRVPAPVIRAGKAHQTVIPPGTAERVTGHERLPDWLEYGRVLLPRIGNVVHLDGPPRLEMGPVLDFEGGTGLRQWVGRIRGEIVCPRVKDHVLHLLWVQV